MMPDIARLFAVKEGVLQNEKMQVQLRHLIKYMSPKAEIDQ